MAAEPATTLSSEAADHGMPVFSLVEGCCHLLLLRRATAAGARGSDCGCGGVCESTEAEASSSSEDLPTSSMSSDARARLRNETL